MPAIMSSVFFTPFLSFFSRDGDGGGSSSDIQKKLCKSFDYFFNILLSKRGSTAGMKHNENVLYEKMAVVSSKNIGGASC